MTKYAVLFLLAGLAVGLWLGFNPTTHKQLTKFWSGARTSQVSSQPRPVINVKGFDTSVTQWFRTATKPASTPKSQPSAQPAVVKQISTALQAFWNALRELWLNLMARIKTVKP